MKLHRGKAARNNRKLHRAFPIALLAISAINISAANASVFETQNNYQSSWELAITKKLGESALSKKELIKSDPSKSDPSKSELSKSDPSKSELSKSAQKSLEIGLTSQQTLEILKQIPIKGRAPKTGYSRSAFGPQWSDVDRNGCDTRNDILKRDLVNVVFREKTKDCVIESGILIDPFSNTEIRFERGSKSSMLVQIDHVVSLSNAWQTGIFQASLKERTAFANDPINLLAVKGSLNSQKGDGDAATWLPPYKSFRCKYVALQINVKAKYGLWVTRAEQEAMVRILSSQECR